MMFNRHISANLLLWKIGHDRKPLIIRGARQVGKTTLVRQFSGTYRQSIHLNLELPADRAYFTRFRDVITLTDALLLSRNLSPEYRSDTLVFIDEIQECPEAIAMLRYFHELEPELHVIAAGSLLEHAMHKVRSFPVGRVQMLHMYPLNFAEYLEAIGQDMALAQLKIIPVKQSAHHILLQHFHRYAIIGGMPEVLKKYIETGRLSSLGPVYESIWETYKEDVVKYATNDTEARVIRHIMSTAHLYLDSRIKFQHFGNSQYRSREVSEAFRNLDDAKIIQLIYPSTDLEPPIKSDLHKSPRMQFLDTGLINHELNIQSEMLAMEDLNDAFRGAIIPHLIAQEMISLNTTKATKPHFWVREKKQSSAEVDFLIPHGKYLVPMEVKSGKTGKLKSLHQFIEASDHPYAVRMYAGEFSIENHRTATGKTYRLMNLPYYLGTQIHMCLEYFIRDAVAH
jgi:predicted AAA+ superfamily ATPase